MKKRFDSSDSEADNGEPEMVGSRPDRADEEPSTSGRGSNSDSDSDLDEQEQALEQQLADIPFEILEKLNQDGKGPSPAAARAAAIAAKQKVFHRENKNRPQEMSSKRPVSRFKEVIQVPKRTSKDPRFDPTIGGKTFDRDGFRKRYSFLYNEVLPQEQAAVKEQLKKTKSEGQRRELQGQLTRLQQQLSEEKVHRKAQQLQSEWKAQEKAAVAAGKKPFFLSKSEKRKRELVAKYEELKSSGRLDKYMAKRRKKNAAKDHRYLPSARRPMGAE